MDALTYIAPTLTIAFFFFLICLFRGNSGIPWNWPLLGMSPMLLLNLHQLPEKFYEILERSRGTFLIKDVWFTKNDMLITSDPANVHYITTLNNSNYPKGSEAKLVFDILGNTLLNVDFEEWAYLRGLLHAYLSHQQFHQFFTSVLVDNVNKLLLPFLEQVARQDSVMDLQDLFKRSTYNVACTITTGYNFNTLSIVVAENQFIKAIDDACEAWFSRLVLPGKLWKLLRWFKIGNEKKIEVARQTVLQFATKYMAMKRKEQSTRAKAKEAEKTSDFLKFFFAVDDLNDKDELARDGVIGLTFALYDTTSSALTWFFWLLSRNSKVEDKIREELDYHFLGKDVSQKWQFSSKEELNKLVYLHAALCETLRLYPPSPFVRRVPVKTDMLPSGHHVNPKIRVVMSAYAVGRMSWVWGDDCLEFKPERWINEKGELKYERSAKFFSFSAGPRICPGKEMALSILKATAATILFNFYVEIVETCPVIPRASVILDMKHGLRARIKSRWA